jgi:23S rRNA (cytosine1962-C5)-methyltransferase
VQIDGEWLRNKIAQAHEVREGLPAKQTTGYRVVHGENDGLSGLVVDRYDGVGVIKLYSAVWVKWLGEIVTVLTEILPFKHIVLRLSRHLQKQSDQLFGLHDGQLLWGESFAGVASFSENGLRFEADVFQGQKTGFFLDQRDNRAKVEQLAQGQDVLNLFAYTGGFSLYAGRGGARSVVSVDVSAPALMVAERHFELNSGALGKECRHFTQQSDVFDAIQKLQTQKKQFGLIVVDPPSFAKRATEIAGAWKAYRRLMRGVLPLIARNGVLVFASCSSRIGADDFFEIVSEEAKKSGRRFGEIARTGHAIDHPIGFPEGAYLKCIFLKFES